MKLSDRQINNAKPKDKPYKLGDGRGLFLLVTPAGGKLWKLKYRFDNKEKKLSIGKYPDISLAEARKAADAARVLLAHGSDPCAAKQEAKAVRGEVLRNTFARIAQLWHAAKQEHQQWQPNHAARIWRTLEADVFPHIGNKPITELRVRDIQKVLDGIKQRGALEVAEKTRQWLGSIFKYSRRLEISENNPAEALAGYLPKPKGEHMPALPREELVEFYRRLNAANVQKQTKICLMLIMLCFARNTEIRGGEWCEIDFEKRLWTIPAERMKVPRPHVIPLSDWAVELLQELRGLTGHSPFLFPSRTKFKTYISEATVGMAMKRMGYHGIATPHGFRSLASSVLNEHGYNPDAIERQLAHVDRNQIRAAYNRADYMQERTAFMQWYSDFLRDKYRQAQAMPTGIA